MKVQAQQNFRPLKMKKYIRNKSMILSIACAMLFLASCSKDDDSAPQEPENQAPNTFNLIEIPDGATDIELQPQLTWEAATDPDGDQVTYQIYLDVKNPPQTSIANNLGVNSLDIEEKLQPETNYYWKVVAEDTNGNTTESAVSSFTTRDMTNAEAIVGKWFFESAVGVPPFSACQKTSFFLFTEDLFIQLVMYEEDSSGNCVEVSNGIGTYEVEGDQIQVTAEGSTSPAEIQSLTSTELIMDYFGAILTLSKE